MGRPAHKDLRSGKRINPALPAAIRRAGFLALWTGLLYSTTAHVSVSDLETVKAFAQEVEVSNIFDADNAPDEEEQLLLESDELVYDNDRGLVIAIGNVQIAYGRATLVADKVEYDQLSGRVVASGNVEILEPNGNRIFAREIDITDDFSDGFVSALNIQTPDNTRIAAESAERRDGKITAFNNGVYTACLPCKENPEKPPFWQIRAKKVVVDNETQTVEYEDAQFEFFGRPVARLTRFSHADPAIKRKSGFLFPNFQGSENLGFGYRQGYFFNLAPSYDITTWGTYYEQQGFLGEVEWRQRLEKGEYKIRFAGIDQENPDEFSSSFVDSVEEQRGAIMTSGLFDINDRWQFGWDALFQSDENFARTYELENYTERDITNEVFLVGIGEKNYFDVRLQDFLVQDNQIDFTTAQPGAQTFDEQQANVLPIFDYNAVSDEDLELGQVSLDLNVTSISRDVFQIKGFDGLPSVAADEQFTGLEGDTSRFSAELEWKGSEITDVGAVLTTSLSVRGDGISQDTDVSNPIFNPLTTNESIFRGMAAAMFEIRYPLISSSESVTQIFEPIAQIIARPDETNIGDFANEDAQSLVFDTSVLFERDKFSGYDRVEGGTRANVGFRYSASFIDSSSVDVIFGQSYQLAGDNSFAATNDLVNVGEESGLESTRSDFVASTQLNTGFGISTGVAVRLDEEDLGLKRLHVGAKVIQPDYTFSGSYVFTEAQPNYRFPVDRNEIDGAGSVKINENWRVFGGIRYNIDRSEIVEDSLGVGYSNDCFSFAVSYSNLNESLVGTSSGSTINFSFGLRTVGGFSRSVDLAGEDS